MTSAPACSRVREAQRSGEPRSEAKGRITMGAAPRLTISRRSARLIGPPPTTISLPDGASAARREVSKTVCHMVSVSLLLEMLVEELDGDFIGFLAEGATPTVAGPLKNFQPLGDAG